MWDLLYGKTVFFSFLIFSFLSKISCLFTIFFCPKKIWNFFKIFRFWQKKIFRRDVVHELRVSLDDLYNGTTKKLAINRKKICDTCNGRGGAGDPKRCNTCRGSGVTGNTFAKINYFLANKNFWAKNLTFFNQFRFLTKNEFWPKRGIFEKTKFWSKNRSNKFLFLNNKSIFDHDKISSNNFLFLTKKLIFDICGSTKTKVQIFDL